MHPSPAAPHPVVPAPPRPPHVSAPFSRALVPIGAALVPAPFNIAHPPLGALQSSPLFLVSDAQSLPPPVAAAAPAPPLPSLSPVADLAPALISLVSDPPPSLGAHGWSR